MLTRVSLQRGVCVKYYFRDIYSVRMIQERLKSVEKVVNLYDRSLLTEIGELYVKALNAFHQKM